MPMLIPEWEYYAEKELEVGSLSVLMLTNLVEPKTFYKWKSQRVLVAFYYLLIRNLLLLAHERRSVKQ